MAQETKQSKAILLVSIVAFILSLIKLVVGILSGSVVILASALDSALDVIVSFLNYLTLKKSIAPSNERFNYGYGKLEGMMSLFEALIIAVSGAYIIYESIIKLIQNRAIDGINQGIATMILSIIVTFGIVIYLKRLALKNNSVIIKAEILHYKTDLLSNLAVIVSLVLIIFTGYEWLDSVFGIALGLYIGYNAFKIAKEASFILLDRSIDDTLQRQIVEILDSSHKINSYHELKTRLSGNIIFLECHLVFDDKISLLEAHRISDDIEGQIVKLSQSYDWEILIHLDPYDDRAR